MTSLFLAIAVVLYVLATVQMLRFVQSKPSSHAGVNEAALSSDSFTNAIPSLKLAFVLGCIATVSHVIYASQISIVEGMLNLSLNSMLVLISCIVVSLYLLGSSLMPIKRLGILVFPLTALSLLFSMLWPNEVSSEFGNQNQALNGHILVSILAFSVLGIAAIQAVLYAYQERQIKQRTNPALLMALPPLQTMELLLFRIVTVGFVLLSVALVSGALFSQEIFGHAFEFKHHTILGMMGWIVFAILLFKRIVTGIPGSQAVIWTIGGFVLINLGYFGTKMITESLAMV